MSLSFILFSISLVNNFFPVYGHKNFMKFKLVNIMKKLGSFKIVRYNIFYLDICFIYFTKKLTKLSFVSRRKDCGISICADFNRTSYLGGLGSPASSEAHSYLISFNSCGCLFIGSGGWISMKL